MPRSIRQTIRLAAVSEKLGFAAFGVGDGHFLHHDLYAVITAALLNTNSIKVAPCTSNTVTRATGPSTLPRHVRWMSCAPADLSLAWLQGTVRCVPSG